MLRTLVRVALGAALVAPLAACGHRETAAPAAVVPEVPVQDPAEVAQQAKEAAFRKHFDEGMKALAAGAADAAVPHLKRAVSEKPDAADAHFQLGRAFVAAKDDDAALDALTEAIRLDPRFVAAYLERGALHDRAGRIADAGYDYYRVIDIDPDRKTTARAYWLHSSTADRLGKRDIFRSDRQKAMELDPEYQKLVTAGDLRVCNHTDANVKIAFEQFVKPDGSLRTFAPGFYFAVPGNTTEFLLDGDRGLAARSVRYTLTTNVGSTIREQKYERGTVLEIHINPSDLPLR